ncbi:MAG: hypothetical protein K2X03_23955 [Bryobacteraceae bacterium]|nr:hypothetical protein [Bryobacteraceae bacterium]
MRLLSTLSPRAEALVRAATGDAETSLAAWRQVDSVTEPSLLPQVFRNLSQHGHPAAAFGLRRDYHECRRRNQQQLAILRGLPGRILLLDDAALALGIYGDPAARPIERLALLASEPMPEGGEVTSEICQDEAIWEQAWPVAAYVMLPPVRQLLRTCVQAAHGQSQWAVDALLTLRACRIDWEAFLTLAQTDREDLANALEYLRESFQADVPRSVIWRLRGPRVWPWFPRHDPLRARAAKA